MKIYAVRHGETKLNQEHRINSWIDEPLSEKGEKQAKLAKNMLPADIKIIYCSPLIRAKETAEVINTRFQIPIIYSQDLTEVNWGSLAGENYETIARDHGEQYGIDSYKRMEYNFRPFGGESVDDVRRRIHEVINQIKLSHEEGPVLIVAHGGILRMLNHDWNQKMTDVMPNGHILEVEI